MGGFRQFQLYLWKNSLQKGRGYGQTCCETLSPVILVAMFAWLYTLVDRSTIPDTTYECDMAVIDNSRNDIIYLPRELNTTVTRLGLVGDPDILNSFTTYLNTWYPGLSSTSIEQLQCSVLTYESQYNNLPSTIPSFNNLILTFPDEASMESYILSDGYGESPDNPGIYSAVVFTRTGGYGSQGGQWSYKIRTNASNIPDTHTQTDDLQRGVSLVTFRNYISGNTSQWSTGLNHPINNRMPGFIPLQIAVDRFILNTTNGDTTGNLEDIATFLATWNCSNSLDPNSQQALNEVGQFLSSHVLLPQRVRVAPFPTASYISDSFYAFVESVFALIFVMSFFFPSFFLIRGLVAEKEAKLREGMRMMGMRDLPLLSAWYATYGFIFLIIAFLVAITVKATMFSNSDSGLIFLFFWLFGLTATALCFLISTFFSKAKLASIVGAVLFIATFFPYFSVNDPLKSTTLKNTASLGSPVAFGLALDIIATLESNDSGLTWDNIGVMYNNYSFANALMMLFIDFILYSVLGWYSSNVFPQDFGVPLPWYFFTMVSYWEETTIGQFFIWLYSLINPNARDSDDEDNESEEQLLASLRGKNAKGPDGEDWEPTTGMNIEPPGTILCDLGRAGRTVSVRGLKKQFNTPDGIKVAVAGVDMDMFEGQIFALLGHNGAGKTTTISMLTGLIPPSSGDAMVYGRSMRKAMAKIRSNMGVCPQHDVLWPDLTVEEHLKFFAGLKGVPVANVPGAVAEVVRDVGLTEKIRTLSKDLSGGMKRKLSVAIALIGGSKVVFLDEPTSGMDPYSRRSTWQILQNAREGRIMVLTTHFMDEADILGDRIAIMANGRIRCCGSSMYLKRTFGVGYNLTLVKQNICDEQSIQKILYKHVADAKLLSNVGAELSFQMPLGASNSFPNLFANLEKESARLGVASYGVSVTTLEEVFLKVAEEGEEHEEKDEPKLDKNDLLFSTVNVPMLKDDNIDFNEVRIKGSLFFRHFVALWKKRWHYAIRDRRAILFQLLIPIAALSAGLALLHQVTLATWPSFVQSLNLYNQGLNAETPGGVWPPNFVPYASNPVSDSFVTAIEQSGNNAGGNYPGAGAAAGARFVPVYGIDTDYPAWPYYYGNDSSTSSGDCTALSYEDGLPTIAVAPIDDFYALPSTYGLSKWLLAHRNGSESGDPTPVENGASRYFAFVLNNLTSNKNTAYASYTALVNTTAFHIAPTAISIMNSGIYSWLASQNSPGSSIEVINAPLPFTERQGVVVSSITSFTAVLFVVIAFSFIPASFAVFVVRERETGAKHQQLISGVSIPAYWCSTYAWDMCNYALPCAASIALVAAFDIKELLGTTLPATIALFVLYGLSCAPFTYCISYFFKSHSTAQTMTLVFNLGCLVLLLASYVMHLIPSTCDVDASLRFVFRLIPGFALGNGLLQLAVLQELPFLENDCGRLPLEQAILQKFTAWSLPAAGYSVLFMALEAVFYFALAIAIDMGLSYPWLRAKLLPDKDHPETIPDDDSDVIAEAKRVNAGKTDNEIVIVDKLRKVYGGGKTAVRNLSFGLPPGECFGFLGINGAGKTTTMKILTGDIVPTSGTARLGGYDILHQQQEVRRLVGYCPQFDALLDLLTVKEHLELYARIKGVPEHLISSVVSAKIQELDLVSYSNKLAGSLSGGNKRKTSVALAMIGEPLLLFLDEPSTGMDPVARRFMWRVISRIATERKRCSIMLTTHSMEEAEALCTRIGIMVGGRLRCLGSSQHLKSKFGRGYMALFKLNSPPAERIAKTLELLKPYLEVPTNDESSVDTPNALIGGLSTPTVDPTTLPIGKWILPARNILPVCTALGDPSRSRMLHPSSTGWAIASQLKTGAGVDAQQFADWWAGESLGAQLHRFVSENFPGAELVERHGEFFRYKLPLGGQKLSTVFSTIEADKAGLHIGEYSLSQISLESIFNAFAATQDEERGVARGVANKSKNTDSTASSESVSSPISNAAIDFIPVQVDSARSIQNTGISTPPRTTPKSSFLPTTTTNLAAWAPDRKAAGSPPGIVLDNIRK